jgi:O-antigen/teichoic acid export membrane protein
MGDPIRITLASEGTRPRPVAERSEQITGAAAPGRARMTGVVARLTGANVLGAASGFITGPLLARALGASGRGDLAAVVVPFTLASAIVGLGIGSYAYRALPRGRRVGDVLGSLGLPILAIGAAVAAMSVPLADAFADGRHDVRLFLIVGFMSMPVVLLGGLLVNSLGALERWRSLTAARLLPFGVTSCCVVSLYLAGVLTVSTAAAATIAGAVATALPGLTLVRAGRLRFERALAKEGIAFGAKSWVGGLASIGNARLDQLMMVTAVAPRELGLYAVAVTISGASGLASGAVSPPLMARVASGETALMSQAVRIMLLATIGVDAVLAVVAPLLLAALFGPQFHDALPMVLILLVAQVFLSGSIVLSAGLQADGAPLIPTIGELIALAITVPGLVIVLGPLGGLGAAIVSLAAYAASFTFQLVMAHRRTGIAIGEFVVPSRPDFEWALGRVAGATGSLRFGH